MIALVVFTDGRDDCLARTIESAEANLVGPITMRLIYDDTGDSRHASDLSGRYPGFHVHGGDERRGFGGAISAMWEQLARGDRPFVFHLEDDFTFNRPVDLEAMASVLDHQPRLRQLALRRQPWNDEERASGGIVEAHPTDFTDKHWNGHRWLEHRRFFTTNPCLYKRSLCQLGWPDVDHSEGVFTHHLLGDPQARFGYWGARDSGEWVTHIGHQRVGVGY